QMLNKTTYHSNIYTLPIFKTIQSMLIDIINNKLYCDFPEDSRIELANGEFFRFNLERNLSWVEIKGVKKSSNINYEWKELQSEKFNCTDILLYRQLSNQDLALITKQ